MSENDDRQKRSAFPYAGLGRRDALVGASAAALSLVVPRAALGATVAQPALAEIANGKLRGEKSDGVISFKGIPYGAPTGGANRFRAPQPVANWAGTRDATKLGNQCPQVNPDHPAWLDPSEQSEDCLYLNVWAPERPKKTGKLPVMVWFHGGGFTFGSAGAPLYDGGNLAREGNVIVVGVNHRLNVFGYSFLGTSDERFASSGNAGHLDMVEALRWVRDNIATFGGDRDNVTIFGESGGACKVISLLGMPMAQGLFHKAIVQSGRLLTLRTPALGSALTDKIYTKLGIRNGDIAALQRVPASLLASLYIPAAGEVTNIGPHAAYSPTVDGVVFKEQPWHRGSPASSRGIPMIIGTNLDETIGWIGEDIHKPYPTDDAIIAAAIQAARFVDIPLGIMAGSVPSATMATLVAASHRELPGLAPAERLVRVSTDACFRAAAIRQSELRVQSGDAPVYSYECRWRTPCYGGEWAPHGIDVPAVFGHSHYGVAWDGKDNDEERAAADKCGLWAQVQRRMLDAWAAFAWNGNPSTSTLAWPKYDLDLRSTMAFDGASRVEPNPRPLSAAAAAPTFAT